MVKHKIYKTTTGQTKSGRKNCGKKNCDKKNCDLAMGSKRTQANKRKTRVFGIDMVKSVVNYGVTMHLYLF